MRYDNLLDPISADAPCGPDLDAEGDDAYLDYYYEALARIPERFLTDGQPFDRKEIDLKTEVAEIGKLLERSRDLRLLVLEAKFQALAGNISGFSECVQASNALTDAFWEDLHPRIVDGDNTERRNTIELLDDRSTVVLPLEHAPLIRDSRIGGVSFRDYQVATGSKEAREGETPPDAGSIMQALKSPENAEQVDGLYAALTEAQGAIKAIDLRCKTSAQPFAPTSDNVEGVLKTLFDLLIEARPDLEAEEETPEETTGTEDGTEAPATEVASGPPVAVGEIANHAQARRALEAVETYYARVEPSSPGLILVRQAKLLIGKPLMEALETLLPNVAEQARIDFGTENGFNMTVSRMKMLSDIPAEAAAQTPEADAPPMVAENRQQASALITNVEAFFRQTEPSSPVPILLFKAKTFLNRDFSAIINDLFSHVGKED